jgi:phosphoribosylformimino-5-aminoimidazole carboxamide ribotide isomerase
VDVYPAIDLRDGRCVRLVEGDFSAETVYSDDPVAVARGFQAAGARWIHVVDLDAARTGEPANRAVVCRIAAAAAVGKVQVQAGGGVRRVDDVADLLAGGVARVVVGTAAIERPDLVAEMGTRWPGQVAVGLDHRGGDIQVRGWTSVGGRRVLEVVPQLVACGVAALIVTDIRRDGRLAGPDIDGLAALLSNTGAAVIASGGVRDIEDLRALAALRVTGPDGTPVGLAGAVIGTAIYEGRLDLAGALAEIAPASGRPAQ